MMVQGRLLPLGLAWAGLIARGFGDQVSLVLSCLGVVGVWRPLHPLFVPHSLSRRDEALEGGGDKKATGYHAQGSQHLCAMCDPSRRRRGGGVSFGSPKLTRLATGRARGHLKRCSAAQLRSCAPSTKTNH